MKLYKVKKSKIDNFGLYASKDIKKGSKIIQYKGKVITRKEAEENNQNNIDYVVKNAIDVQVVRKRSHLGKPR